MISKNPKTTKSWPKLERMAADWCQKSMREVFQQDPHRAKALSFEYEGLRLDLSRNLFDQDVLNTLLDLLQESGFEHSRKAMFSGAKINATESRAVMHTALRNFGEKPVMVDDKDVMPAVSKVLSQMCEFSEALRHGKWLGFSGMRIDTIVNIGIGGSDLGPKMVYEALKFLPGTLKTHFVSNVDGADWAQVRQEIHPERTLFIIASKTFTTQETMANAHVARQFILDHFGDVAAIAKHFVAVSTNSKAVRDFGIAPENMFEFWDWVGGRYSLWSAIGLSIACSLGYSVFQDLLRGGYWMDCHFLEAPSESNLPVLLALTGIWYRNFLDCRTHAILPYAQHLHRFPSFLQQADMESNGKSMDRNGQPVDYHTGPVVWGEPGTNGQHAFFQLMHQGTSLIPADLIAFVNPEHPELVDQHHKLLANCFAQAKAFMQGRTIGEAIEQLRTQGLSEVAVQKLAPYRVFAGNKPTSTIIMDALTPFNLGRLIALYEHKIFVQGIIWNIYSFDQWGVELGKELAGNMLGYLTEQKEPNMEDQAVIENLGFVNRKLKKR
jgi:glucose-6-phosphate isomerase